MIDKANIEKTNAWPFVEAKKILRERKIDIEKKGKIILQTGYGPSGLPTLALLEKLQELQWLLML